MKPKTKRQKEVAELNKRLSLKKEWKEWAAIHCLPHQGFATVSRVICLDCGERFSADIVFRKRATCPHCKTRLEIEKSAKRTHQQHSYFTVAEVCEQYQVIRNFEITGHCKENKRKNINVRELTQFWIDDKGNFEIMARAMYANWHSYNWTGDIEIRPKNDLQKYDVYPVAIYPKSKFRKVHRKYGINSQLRGLTLFQAVRIIPKECKAETLLKAKQYELLYLIDTNRKDVYMWWHAIKICLRNKYKIKDSRIWVDYLELLKFFNKISTQTRY